MNFFVVRCLKPMAICQHLQGSKYRNLSGFSWSFPRISSIRESRAEKDDVGLAEHYWKVLKEKGCDPNVEFHLGRVRKKLISSCVESVVAKCGNHDRLLGLRFFIWAGQQPLYRHTRLMYNRACDVLGLYEQPHSLIQVLEDYRKEGCLISIRTFKEMLSLCKEAKLAQTGLTLLRLMPELGCQPDTISYNSVISLYTSKDIDVVRTLVEEMSTHEIYPDMVTYIALVKGLCINGKLDDAKDVLRGIRNSGCVPNVVIYSTLVDEMCKAGRPDKAMELIDEMHKDGVFPNVVTYTSLIQKLCKDKRSNEAIQVLDKMVSNGCFPNRVTLILLFKGLLVEERQNDAFALLERSVSNSYMPHDECYSLFVITLLQAGKLIEAEKLVGTMLATDTKPSGLACETFIKELCAANYSLSAFDWYCKMDSLCCFLDSEVYAVLLLGLCRQSHVPEAATLIRMMSDRGVPLKASYQQPIFDCIKENDQNILHMHLLLDKGKC